MNSQNKEARYAFNMEWFDSQAELVRNYRLHYYSVDDTIEMFDLKNKRTFLKRCSYPSVKLSDLFVGSAINVYARQLKVLDYGDEWTRNKLSVAQARTLVVVKPTAYKAIGSVISHLYGRGLQVSKLRMLRVSKGEAASVFGQQADVASLSAGPIVAMEVVGEGTQAVVADFQGQENMVYVSSPEHGATQCKQLLENAKVATTAQFDNCAIAVVRPHAIHQMGSIIDSILKNGFEISAMQMFNLDRQAADTFLEVYKGISPEYNAMAESLTTGASLALEVRGEMVVERLREFCGPTDPEIARLVRPSSLRAEFGEDVVRNAIHCTDLPEDGVLESEYFFNILQQSAAVAFNRQPAVSCFTGYN